MLAIGRCGKRSSQNERRSKPQISCKTSSCPMILEHKKSASVDSLPIIALGISGVVILAMDSRLAFPNTQGYPHILQQLSAHRAAAHCLPYLTSEYRTPHWPDPPQHV